VAAFRARIGLSPALTIAWNPKIRLVPKADFRDER
jgi:hypothetical protein